jgi:beta-lactamase superfamily II metal-dependent hydrolase
MFSIEMMPAQRGDALWITYGTREKRHHVLIDAGPSNTIPEIVPELERRIAALPGRTDRVELFVITHIDADHIQGVISLLSDPARVPIFGDVWFNGWKHISELLGGVDAERLTGVLAQHPDRWNAAFEGGAVMIPDEGELPVHTLPGGLTLTVLAPDAAALRKLAPKWDAEVRKAGLIPGEGAPITRKSWQRSELLGGFEIDLLAESKFSSDGSAANCAGIALIAEYEGQRMLLLGDSAPGPILDALDRLGPRPHRFTAVKMAHHGSRRNTNLEFAEAVQSTKWLVSTNGAGHDHPDPEALARVIVSQRRRPTFFFNYDTEHISDIVAEAGERYRVTLPKLRRDGTRAEGLVVRL